MFRPTLFLLSALLLVGGGQAICTPYQSACNLLTSITCCGFPLLPVLCLPDNNNGTSCLLPLDAANLSPEITNLIPIIGPLIRNMENATDQVIRTAVNPMSDPLANPILDPLANPILDPLANPILDPLVNPILNPLANPMMNPFIRP